jgi:hypothetical protein
VQGRVSLLRSLHCFLIVVAIKILLLRSLNAFCCGSAALCLCGEIIQTTFTTEKTVAPAFKRREHAKGSAPFRQFELPLLH